MVSIWDGVFTQDQADRGQQVASGACTACHGARLNGVPDDPDMQAGPPLSGPEFLDEWAGRPPGALFSFSHLTMPLNDPGSLPPADYAAVVAYMLSASGAPAGDTRILLIPKTLGRIRIVPEP